MKPRTRLARAFLTGLLSLSLVLQGCTLPAASQGSSKPVETRDKDADLTQSANRVALQDAVYRKLIDDFGDKAFIENVNSAYLSEEYIEELVYNSQENIYFGYSLADLDTVFQGQRYVFTVDEDGKTVVHEFSLHDTTYEKALKDMAIGGGVILFCITVSTLASPAAPALSMMFATPVKAAVTDSVIAGGISAAVAAASTAAQTGNLEETLKAGVSAGAEGFKCAAIVGAVTRGASKAAKLYGASRNGLTMNQAATIQRESKWSLDSIKAIHSVDEYQHYKKIGLQEIEINGHKALVQKVDWNLKDESGKTNRERALKGTAPIGKDGKSFDLHHVGQELDSPLAILTPEQHRLGKSYKMLHSRTTDGVHSEISDPEWAKTRREFWKALVELSEKATQ